MKKETERSIDRATIVKAFACAMVAITVGGMLHKSQDMDWNPFLQGSWAISGAMTYLLLREAVRFARNERAA